MGAIKDIAADIRAIRPTARECRKLGLVFLVALGVFGGLTVWRSGPWGWWPVGAGAGLGLLGLLWPAGMKPIYLAWMALATVLGYFMSRLLLSVIFYLVLTPIGLVRRALGKRPLDLKLGDRDSYWRVRDDEYEPVRTEKMY